jgi:hypothetical protein
MALELRQAKNKVSNMSLTCVLPSVKNEYVDNNSITEQTGLQNFLL